LENPKTYYVFYQFFYKAAVGEVCWKECMDGSEAHIGNETTEAFALLLFANNYTRLGSMKRSLIRVKHCGLNMTLFQVSGGTPSWIDSC
jgi:hypothetical protein